MKVSHEDEKSGMEEEEEEELSRERPKTVRARDFAAKPRTTPGVPAVPNFKPALPSTL